MATLRAGSSVSHYKVVSSIGAGGMGEVYKAIDETLERPVALKILPAELTKNDERVRRFVQEAKSASSLSHPHIVSIYEIGQAEVQDDGASHPVHYIAMELVDGRTLTREIYEERTDLRALLGYLAQIADALAKAHGAGIVHRDLKPENVMISRDGYAKVLDFGLAKLTEKRPPGEGQTSAPTAVREKTREGTVLGTVGYMSPEQVQGKAVDHRSDIFSFGLLLYEAAARQRAFDADSDVDIMHKILHDKPQPVDELNPNVPAEVRRMIKRCIAKDPDRRFQSMKDVAIELGDIIEEWDTLSASKSSGSTSFPSGAVEALPARRTKTLIGVLGAVAVIAVAALIWALMRKPAKPASVERAAPAFTMSRVTGTGNAIDGAISPDGRYLAYVAVEGGNQNIKVRQISTGSEVNIVDSPTPINGLVFSSDGDYIYYSRTEQLGPGYATLFQIPTLGGTPRKILFDVDTEPNFSPDGKRFTFQRGYPQFGETTIMVANADGSGERRLATQKSPNSFPIDSSAIWSPDGKVIATALESQEGGYSERPVLIDPATGKVSPLGTTRFFDLQRMAWLPDGSTILAVAVETPLQSNRQIWQIAYPAGEATRLTSDLSDYASLSITADGRTIAASQQNLPSNLWIVPPGGTPKKITTGSAMRVTDIEVGEKRVYFVDANTLTIWSTNRDGSDLRPLLNDNLRSWAPQVPDDESFVVFVSSREGNVPHIFRVNADGSGLRKVTPSPTRGDPAFVSPDGKSLIFIAADGTRLMRMPIDGSQEPAVFADRVLAGGAFSPDGTKIAYAAYVRANPDDPGSERGRGIVTPVNGGAPLITFEGRSRIYSWAPQSDGIDGALFLDGAGNIWRQKLSGGEPQKVTNFDSGLIWAFGWGKDGTLYLGRGEASADIVLISGFQPGSGAK